MRRTLKKFASLLMALVILLSLAVPTALAASEIKVPISIKIPHAVAGVQFELEISSGLKYVEWEKSSAIRSASYIDNVTNGVYEKTGVLLVGIFNVDNKYAPDANGVLDLGYLVFDGTTADQEVVITKATFSRVVNKDATDSREVTEDVIIDLSNLSSGGAASNGGGVVIDGSNAAENILTAGEGSSAFPFVDVQTTDWFYDEVKGAYENGLINGVTATEYRPNETLTVAQAIKLAAALHQLDNTGSVTLQNGTGNWYSSYVNYAVNNGIIEAKYQNYTTAQMNASISRNEFVHIFHGAMDNYTVKNTVADNAIPDVKTGNAYAAEIYEFYRAGILTGSDGAGTFYPNNAIKRSEVAAILVRMYDVSVRETITLG